MNAISRRGLLVASAAVVPAALSGCALFKGMTPAQITQAALGYAAQFANGLATVATDIQGVPPATAAQIKTIAQDAADAAAKMQAGMAQTAAQPVASQIIADVTDVAAIAQPYFANNPTVASVMHDLQLAEPLLLLGVGILTAGAAPGANAAAAMGRLEALPRVSVR